jgi:voltage-gated potassium channel Kch
MVGKSPAWLIRDHVIVCGAGKKGVSLIRDMLQGNAGRPIVVIEPGHFPEIEELQRAGVVILRGEAGSSALFKEARLERASTLVCLTGDDRTNIGIALAATACIPGSRSSNPLEIHVHVSDVERRHILQRNQILDLQDDPRHRIRFFNCFVNRARRTWEIYPLEWDRSCGLCDKVHLVIGEMGAMEKAMVVKAGYVGHFLKGGRVTVHLISTRAKQDAARLLKDYPGLSECAHLEVTELEAAEDFVDVVAALATQVGDGALLTVVPSAGDAPAALTDALLLGERFHGEGQGGGFFWMFHLEMRCVSW